MAKNDALKSRLEELFSTESIASPKEQDSYTPAPAYESAGFSDSVNSAMLQKRIQELDCLNDIGHRIDEKPGIDEFLEWLANRIPGAMQHPDYAITAITLHEKIYGNRNATTSPNKIVAGIRVNSELLGYIHIAYTREQHFLDEESAFIGAVVGRVSGYLENVKLIEEMERQSFELTVLNEMSQSLSNILHTEQIGRIIFNSSSKLLGFTGFYLACRTDLSESVTFPFLFLDGIEQKPLTRSAANGLSEYIIDTGEPMLLNGDVHDLSTQLGLNYSTNENDENATSWIGVPIIYEKNVLGVISISTSEPSRLFTDADLDLLVAIARQSAVSIKNSQNERRLEINDEELLKFKRGIDQSSDAVFITDLDGTITYVNPAFEKTYGYTEREALGSTPRILKSGKIPQEQYQYFWNTLLSGEIITGELVNKTKDGRILPIEGANVPIFDEDKNIMGFLAIHRDISSRKEAETLIAKRSSDLETIAELSTIISSILDPEDLLKEVVNQVRARFNLYHAQIYLLNNSGNELLLAAGAGDIGVQMVLSGWEIPINKPGSIVARSAREKKGIMVNDTTLETGFLPNYLLPNTKAEMAVPIETGGKLLGILDVQSNQINPFSPEDVSIMTTLAAQIAVALQNANQYKETQDALSKTSALLRISQASSGLLEIGDILRYSLESIIATSGYHCGLISMVDKNTNKLELTVQQDLPAQLSSFLKTHGFDGTLCEFVYTNKSALFIEDLKFESPVNVSGLLGLGLLTYYGIPLRSRDEYLGTLCLFGEKPREKEEWLETLMEAVSRQISISIENSFLLSETQKALRQADQLYQGGDRVIHASNQQMLLEAVVESTPAIEFDQGLLLIFNKPWDKTPPDNLIIGAEWKHDRYEPDSHNTIGVEDYLNLVVDLAKPDQPVLIRISHSEPKISERSYDLLSRQPDILSIALFPLVAGDQFIGLIMVQSREDLILDESSIRQISSLTDQAATVLQGQMLRTNLQSQLVEMENLQRMLSREAWTQYLSREENDHWGYEYNRIEVQPITDNLFSGAQKQNDKVYSTPLEVRGEIIGGLGINIPESPSLTDEEQNFLEAVAEQLSQALERARLIEQTQKSAVELQTVARVSSASSTLLEPVELLQSVVDLAKNGFNLYHAHIYLLDESGTKLVLSSGSGEIGRQMVDEGWIIFLDEDSIVSRAARSRQGQIVNNVWNTPDYLPNPLLPDTKSELAVPMVVGSKLLGIFDVQSNRPNYFTEEDLQTFSTLASQASVALQNARLYAEQTLTVERLTELDHLKTSFLANMSHELRTPLNSILGFTQVILEGIDGPLTDYMVSDLQLIEKNGKHLLNLINEVLDMAKIESGRMSLTIETVDLRELITDVLETTSGQAREKGIYLSLDLDPDEAFIIQADQMRLRQIMINLIGNSLKFTENGGVSVKVNKSFSEVTVLVEDTGIGVPAENLETIFEAFSQVDTSTTRKAGGTGLGLPISRRLVEMHGGKLWAESSGLGHGTTMHLVLPVKAKTN